MRPAYDPEIVESCASCNLRSEGFFCNLPGAALPAFEAIKCTNLYPKGAVLFVEGQRPRGIYVLCRGRVKLSASSSGGKTLILRIAEPGDVLGLSAAVSDLPYEATAETLEPSQTNFVQRGDFLQFLRNHADASFRVAQHLSRSYHTAYVQIRSLGLSSSAAERLAKLLLEWAVKSGKETGQGIRLKLGVTHEEIARMIGTSRETVSRLMGEFKAKEIIHVKGSTLLVLNRAALSAIVGD